MLKVIDEWGPRGGASNPLAPNDTPLIGPIGPQPNRVQFNPSRPSRAVDLLLRTLRTPFSDGRRRCFDRLHRSCNRPHLQNSEKTVPGTSRNVR